MHGGCVGDEPILDAAFVVEFLCIKEVQNTIPYKDIVWQLWFRGVTRYRENRLGGVETMDYATETNAPNISTMCFLKVWCPQSLRILTCTVIRTSTTMENFCSFSEMVKRKKLVFVVVECI